MVLMLHQTTNPTNQTLNIDLIPLAHTSTISYTPTKCPHTHALLAMHNLQVLSAFFSLEDKEKKKGGNSYMPRIAMALKNKFGHPASQTLSIIRLRLSSSPTVS